MLRISLGVIVMTPQDPAIFGMPIDFILLGLTLPGVAVFHEHTMCVALAGLVTAVFYKILLLSPHFEKSRVPLVLPKYLPHDWKGGFVLLGIVWILSSFLDNIAGALMGGVAHQLFRAKVRIGYVLVIVATSSAGGVWSVPGDRK
jgi:hypothetical protein